MILVLPDQNRIAVIDPCVLKVVARKLMLYTVGLPSGQVLGVNSELLSKFGCVVMVIEGPVLQNRGEKIRTPPGKGSTFSSIPLAISSSTPNPSLL